MLIRFVIHRRDEDSHVQQGVFQPLYALRDSGDLAGFEYDQVVEQLTWFKNNLIAPDVLEEQSAAKAISWFKPEAKEPVERLRMLQHVLEEHGYLVKMLKTDLPGRVVYEDKWQIVAVPFRDGSPV
jgi:hypothetical protein